MAPYIRDIGSRKESLEDERNGFPDKASNPYAEETEIAAAGPDGNCSSCQSSSEPCRASLRIGQTVKSRPRTLERVHESGRSVGDRRDLLPFLFGIELYASACCRDRNVERASESQDITGFDTVDICGRKSHKTTMMLTDWSRT